MVSALLLGGNVAVRKGRDAGGDFKRVPACRSARQTGCVVAYSSFNAQPPADTLFGKVNDRGFNWLQVDDVGGAADSRRRVTASLGTTWGLHLVDVSIALGNLVDLVGRQSAAYSRRA